MVSEMSIKNTFENGFFWNNYKSIESNFLDFLEYVPYCESNIKMYSPKLAGLLLQIGGYVDSAFKEMAKYFVLRAYIKKKDGTAKRAKVITDIVDAYSVYGTIYNLSSNNGDHLIAKLDFGDKEMYPFKNFSSSNFDSPEWWDAYNKVKHEYSLHYKKASIDNVLNGLAGAFLLNAIHYPGIKLLWQLGYLTTGIKAEKGFAELFLNENDFDRYMQIATLEFKPLNIGIRIETPLFLYVHP